jgi:phosphoribosylglycinamide formyltransferase 1
VKVIGILVSGRGTNLQALIDASVRGVLGGTIAVVVSNTEAAPALERARRAGIRAVVSPHRGRPRAEQEAEILGILRERGVELVCLAGYMRRLSPSFIEAFGGPILNVHPSLLPAFPGLGAQRQAWEHGVKVAGATVHLVDEALDSGPIVAQEAVAVREDDTPEDLAGRILEVEHRLFPRAVRILLQGRYRIEGRRFIAEEA